MTGNYARYVLFVGANVAISYALLLLFANNLNTADYALYGVINSIAGLGLIALNFGHKEALFKFESQSNYSATRAVSASLWPWLVGALCLVVCLLAANLTVGVAALSFLCLYALTLASNIFRGRGHYARDASAIPIYRSLWLLSGLLVLALSQALTLFWVFVASTLSALVTFGLLGGPQIFSGLFRSRHAIRLPFSNSTLRNFFWLELATVAYLKLDLILLKLHGLDHTELAHYFFAMQVFEAAVLILSPLAYLFFNRYNQALNQLSLKQTLIPFALAAVGVGAGILLLWYGVGQAVLGWMFPRYIDSFDLSLYLMLALIPMGLSMLLSHALFATHRESVYVKICAMGFAVCLGMNLILIPTAGVLGAAWARVATELVILFLLAMYFGVWVRRRSQF